MVFHCNTLTLLYDNVLPYSANNLTTLTDLFITDMNPVNTLSIHEPCRALGRFVELAQHFLGNPYIIVTTMVM
jgi:hypothetical protein